MVEREDELLDHDFDGIKELNNSMPRWWVYIFYISVIFSVAYFVYYHILGIGYLQEDEYRRQLDPNFVRAAPADSRLLGLLPEYRSPLYRPGGDITPRMIELAKPKHGALVMTRENDTMTYAAVTDAALLADGEQTFKTTCATCHGKLGEGLVGPNLTDDYWLHGGTISDIVRSIKYGYPAKGMPTWIGTLKQNQVIDVASYVRTLRGTNPSNARPPQGVLVKY